MYAELKQLILANLDFLPNKVDFTRSNDQMVRLKSEYNDKFTNKEYLLTLHLKVAMFQKDGENKIGGFSIEEVFFFEDRYGSTPSFSFTRTELIDYIDY